MRKTITIPLPFKSLKFTIDIAFITNNRKKAYNQYIASKKWREFRSGILKERGFHCELCKSQKNLELHHLSYANFGFEKPEQVIILCENCHKKAHTKPK
jgi:5-methylcytosine-specific restriction endonuclease McrA